MIDVKNSKAFGTEAAEAPLNRDVKYRFVINMASLKK